MATNEPMTDERLAEIRARVKNARIVQAAGPANMGDLEPWQLQSIAVAYVDDVADLLAEVDRLRAEVDEGNAALHEQIQAWMSQKAENDRLRAREQALAAENEQKQAQIDAMRPVVEAVAEHIGGYVSEHFRQCAFCGNGAVESRIIVHANDCEVEQACAFVAAHPTDTAGEAESED